MSLRARLERRLLPPAVRWPPPWLGPRGEGTRIVLHIGLHKTGSTAVQETLRANRLALARRGILYPRLGPADVHHYLARVWVRVGKVYALPGGALGSWGRLARQFAGCGRTVVLSSEAFARLTGPRAVEPSELRARLATVGAPEILCVLRGQVALAQSVWLQTARRMRPPPPETMVEAMLETGLLQRPSPLGSGLFADYTALHDRLATAFAPGEMRFIPYEAAAAGPGAVPGAVLRALGLPEEVAARMAAPRLNVSPPALAVLAAQTLAAEAGRVATAAEVAAAAGLLAERFGPAAPGCIFTRAEVQALAARFEPLNAALAARLAPVQGAFALPPLAMPPGTVHREDLGPDFLAALRARLSGPPPSGDAAIPGALPSPRASSTPPAS